MVPINSFPSWKNDKLNDMVFYIVLIVLEQLTTKELVLETTIHKVLRVALTWCMQPLPLCQRSPLCSKNNKNMDVLLNARIQSTKLFE